MQKVMSLHIVIKFRNIYSPLQKLISCHRPSPLKSQSNSSADSNQLTDLQLEWILVWPFQILLFHLAETNILTEILKPQKFSMNSKKSPALTLPTDIHLAIIYTFIASCRNSYSDINIKPSKLSAKSKISHLQKLISGQKQ